MNTAGMLNENANEDSRSISNADENNGEDKLSILDILGSYFFGP